MLLSLTLVLFSLHLTLGVDVLKGSPDTGGVHNRRFTFGNNEYEISAMTTDWFTARNYCKIQGGKLLSIETPEENNAVLQALSGYMTHSIWTSGCDIENEGSFFWDSTGAAFENFSFWAPFKPVANNSEHCVRLNATINHLWSDANCDLEHFFVCEFQPCSDNLGSKNTVAKKINTPMLRFTFENGTYEVFDELVSWDDAKRACKLKGMELVSIETYEEHLAIMDALRPLGVMSLWTSGSDWGHLGSYYWEGSGRDVGPYTGWGPDQPDASIGYHCIYIDYWGSYMWHDVICTAWYDYICELQPCQS